MKKVKKLISSLLVVAMLLTAAPLSGFVGLDIDFSWLDFSTKSSALDSSGSCGDNVTYTFDSSTGLLTISGTGDMKNYSSSSSPFCNNSSIKSVVINYGVTSIGSFAFSGCTGLTSMTIPDSVTSIGYGAFEYCRSLTSIIIPDSVTSIDIYTFYGCTGLKKLTMPCSAKIYNSENTFYDCKNINKVTLTKGTGTMQDYGTSSSSSSTTYYQYTPWYISRDSIKEVVVEDGVQNIGRYAFHSCASLTSIKIPDSVTNIESFAFDGCTGLKELTMPCSAKIDNSLFTFCNCHNIEKVTLTKGTGTMQDYGTSTDSSSSTTYYQYTPWYISKSSIKEIIIEDGVTNLGEYAFFGCTGLTRITVPDSVTSIGSYSFYGCTGLTRITVPDNVTSIGSYSFYGCTGLTSVKISDGVTGIGSCAFNNCNNIYLLVYENSFAEQYAIDKNLNYCIILKMPEDTDIITGKVTNSFLWSVDNSTGTLTIDCNGKMVSFENDVAPWIQYEEYIRCIIINDGCTNISKKAFMLCRKVETVSIPDSVTIVDDYAFYGCTGLKELTMPCSAKIYNSQYTFYNCKNIEKITLAKGTGTMQNYGSSKSTSSSATYYGYTPWYISRSSIKEIIIEDGVTNIGEYSFYGCTGLSSVTIPDSVTSIGSYSFYGCTGLSSITIPDRVTSIDRYAFSGCTGLTSVKIPDSVTSIGGYAFNECSGLTSITIPDSVTSIGSYAFSDCAGLTSIIIPNSVTSIGEGAFFWCIGLTSITIGNSVTGIDNYAFNSCTGLVSITIPDSVTSFGSNVFSGCTNLISIEIGNGVTEIYNSDFKNLTNLKSVTIGTGVTNIGDYAFNGCTGLEEIVIPYNVNSICAAAFTGCTNLGSLTVYNRNCTFADNATAYYTTIYGFTGSTAETYANKEGFDFVAIDDTHEHVYDNVCDSICNLCGNESSLRGHTYYSNCDADCNICGALRVPPHTDNDNDGACDNCGAYLSDIALSTVKNVAVSAGETVYLKFTAPYTGRYTFYSSSSSDTYGYVFDSDKNALASDDESGVNNNFSITTTLTKGTVYYLGLKYYNSSNSGTIPVTIDYICDHTATHAEHIDSTCNEHGYDKVICDICGVTVTTTELPYKHEYVATVTNPTCTEQGYTTYTCSLCGDSYIGDYTDALNHPNKTWRVTKNPTITSTGLMVETCDLCGAKTGETIIPMLIPDYVTGITVSPNRLALNIGETANLTAVITPDTAENKNVIWSSSDTDVATVADGVVTAKTPGVTVIIAQSEDSGYKDFCVVRVASLTPANGAVVDNENGLIYGITSNSADINSYVNTVDGTMSVQYNSDVIGTGSVVNIVKDGAIVDSYKVIIFGDVDGDGWYDGQDAITVSCLANGILTREQVGEAVWMAADCNHDGVIDQLDVDLLNQAGVLLSSVDQTKPTEELLETSAEYNEYLSLIDQMGSEDAPETPTQDENDSFFTRIIAFVESIIKLISKIFTKIF